MFKVNEKSTMILAVSFYDENDAAVSPNSAWYKIDDKDSERSITPQTSIGSLSTTTNVTITSTENRILNQENPSETRIVTIQYEYGSSKTGTAEYQYKVINLFGITANASQSPSGSVSPSASASPSAG